MPASHTYKEAVLPIIIARPSRRAYLAGQSRRYSPLDVPLGDFKPAHSGAESFPRSKESRMLGGRGGYDRAAGCGNEGRGGRRKNPGGRSGSLMGLRFDASECPWWRGEARGRKFHIW